MKRARSPLLTLAGVVLLGTVLLLVGTRGTEHEWGTNSLPGGRELAVYVGGGQIGFDFVDSKWNPGAAFQEGFGSCPVDEAYRASLDGLPDFGWETPGPGWVRAWCPTWFPGDAVGRVAAGLGPAVRAGGGADFRTEGAPMTRPLPPSARARQTLLSLAGIILLGTVLLWVAQQGVPTYEPGKENGSTGGNRGNGD